MRVPEHWYTACISFLASCDGAVKDKDLSPIQKVLFIEEALKDLQKVGVKVKVIA